MTQIYDLITSFLNTENCAAGISGYESLPTGKPLNLNKEATMDTDDLGTKVQKIRDTFKEVKK